MGNKKLIIALTLVAIIIILLLFYSLGINKRLASNSNIMDMPVFPEDTVPKPLLGKSVSFGWMPWVHGICFDEEGQMIVFYLSLTPENAEYSLSRGGSTWTGNFDTAVYTYADGILRLGTSPRVTIDYHAPHNVSIVSSSLSLSFVAEYRGPPLWYAKTLDPNDMLPFNPPNTKIGGYEAAITIVGKTTGLQSFNFTGYGDWASVWFTGGGWKPPSRSFWMIFNSGDCYCEVVEVKADDGTVLFHVGRFVEVGGAAYVFDDYQRFDDSKTLPLSVEIAGEAKSIQGLAAVNVDLRTDPGKAVVTSDIWVLYQNVTLVGSSSAGTAWVEIRMNS